MSAQKKQTEAVISDHAREEIDAWLARYPENQRRSAVLGALRAVQHEEGYLSTPMMDAVAAYLRISPMEVYEAASFYSMYELEPVGRHTIAVCDNVSCMLRGGDRIIEHIENRLGIRLGESTADGRFYLKREEECLAACCGAPMMQVDHVYHENLTPERVDEILAKLES
ncbi:MAG: NADH-quinone oxidoreductase subunit NuoE [Thioalkalivibrio sp.]|nr:NADH-quinone oxidoreductase subunit NuoE [Thioalkalivibrio sp.]